jgi:hypothetical protein
MATRFYFSLVGVGAVSPNFDTNWEQQGQGTRRPLAYKATLDATSTLGDGTVRTVPITTTQDILGVQFISDPLPPQAISGTCACVLRLFESANTVNVTLALSVRVVSSDGDSVRGTLFSVFGTGTEFPLTASAATRIVNNQAVTPLTIEQGDRLVVEVGGRATGPTASGSYTLRFGTSAATDFALTSGLTTDLNPWFELSQNVFTPFVLNNYQFCKAESGISISR